MYHRLPELLCCCICLLPGWLAVAVAEDVSPPASQRFLQVTGTEVPDFQRHVLPLLGRLGCNGRACHGSFQGRGGFSLSLFGYDFAADHKALTGPAKSRGGARISTSDAADSLIIRKASLAVEHAGGQLLQPGSWQQHLLLRWIAAGAPATRQTHTIQSIELQPKQFRWSATGSHGNVTVHAIWTDGFREDVTCLTRFRVNDDAVAAVDDTGLVTAAGFGDTHLIAFYDNAVSAIPLIVSDPQRPQPAWPVDPAPGSIDQLVNSRLKSLGLVPSPVCTDEEFLRRASIDLTGTLPSSEEVRQFLADPSASVSKRTQKIDELLQRPAMAAWWATKLCDFTGCNPAQQAELGQELAQQWYMWIYERLRQNQPWDQLAADILLATSREPGQSFSQYSAQTSAFFRDQQPTSFSERRTMPHFWSRRTLAKPTDKALSVAHAFLGIRLQCAECHKHPWDQWTKDDFQQFSRFFEPVQYGLAEDARTEYRQLADAVGMRGGNGEQGSAINPEQLAKAKTGQVIPWREVYLKPRAAADILPLLRSGNITLQPDQDPREPIVQWLKDPQNPWFARAIVNRVWASCFHVGIVDPPDDLNAANPPSNPELLDWLAAEFIRKNYDLRWLLREITLSSAWQRSCLPNPSNAGDRRNFSRAVPRRLPAEVVYDGLRQVLAAADKQQQIRSDLTRRAVGHLSMRMAGTWAMHVFGKPERAVACDCERVNQPSLLQSVFLQNDPLMHLALEESGWLQEIRTLQNATTQQHNAWIDEAWLRAWGRMPADSERQRALQHLQAADTPAAGLEDLLWSLLNTKEFLLNH
ncbi:MAG: DUF1549 and DUF1553 domain-containing protein [Planctomycetaceae bacterium]